MNADIESIIDPETKLRPHEKVSTLHHVLIEHNDLCRRIKKYHGFWAKFLMATYFFLVAMICFTTFQAFFTHNTFVTRFIMILLTLENCVLITKISIAASLLSTEVSLYVHFAFVHLVFVHFAFQY